MNYKYLFQRPGAVGDAPVAVHLFRGLVAAAHATTGDPHPCGTSYARNGVYLQTDCYATYKMVAAPGMPSVGCGGLTLRSVTYRRTARIASCSRMPLRSRHHRHTMIQKGKLLIKKILTVVFHKAAVCEPVLTRRCRRRRNAGPLDAAGTVLARPQQRAVRDGASASNSSSTHRVRG